MRTYKKNSVKILKRAAAFGVAFLLAAVMLFLPACSLINVPLEAISFKDEVISLRVGDEIIIDFNYIEMMPHTATNKKYRLESTDPSVLRVGYLKTVEAVSVGTAKLRAISDESDEIFAEVDVNVDYAVPDAIELLVSTGETVQYETDISIVSFLMSFKKGSAAVLVSPDLTAEWYVNGESQEGEFGVYDEFLFAPPSFGEFSIEARVEVEDNNYLSAFKTVRVYKDFAVSDITVSPAGALLQEEGEYKTLVFKTGYEAVPGNPEPVIVWYNNDIPVAFNEDDDVTEYSFIPTRAGEYNIRLEVNNRPVPFSGGEDVLTIVAKGKSSPEGIEFDFDTFYPSLMLSWRSNAGEASDVRYAVRVETLNGVTVLDGYEVSGCEIDLREWIGEYTDNDSKNSRNIFNTDFKISVKSLGGGIYSGGDYTEPVIVPAVPLAAKRFLEQKYYNGHRNYYASDIEELSDIFYNKLFFRERQTVGAGEEPPVSTFSFYVGFEYGDAAKLFDEAFSLRHVTGDFPYSVEGTDGLEYTVSVTYKTDSVPTLTADASSIIPNFNSAYLNLNMNPESARPDSPSALPIERQTGRSVSVSTSEQLYTVLENGFRPVPVSGSSAAAIYNEAKEALRFIITPSMTTDFERALAIYDYVCWRYTYDHNAAGINDKYAAVKYDAYYLEGLFGSNRRALCDGIAKSYSLLCNMEMIPCLRVAGTLKNGFAVSGHAWNKVKIDDKWYIADLTLGKSGISLPGRLIGSVSEAEYAVLNHRYFLLTDREVAGTHTEDAPNAYPKTADIPYGFYEKSVFSSELGDDDFYMSSVDYTLEARRFVNRILSLVPHIEGQSPYLFAVGNPSNPLNSTLTQYVSFDYKINGMYSGLYSSVSLNPVKVALEELGLTYDKDFVIVSDGNLTEYQHIFISVHAVPGVLS